MAKTPNRGDTKPLLTLAKVAEQLDCSVKTVQRRVASGALPVIRDGRIVRVDPEDLRRHIAVHRQA